MRRAGYACAAAFFLVWVAGLAVDRTLSGSRHWWDLPYGHVAVAAWAVLACTACALLLVDALAAREYGRALVLGMIGAMVVLAIALVLVNGIRV